VLRGRQVLLLVLLLLLLKGWGGCQPGQRLTDLQPRTSSSRARFQHVLEHVSVCLVAATSHMLCFSTRSHVTAAVSSNPGSPTVPHPTPSNPCLQTHRSPVKCQCQASLPPTLTHTPPPPLPSPPPPPPVAPQCHSYSARCASRGAPVSLQQSPAGPAHHTPQTGDAAAG
jgi:hypothetical protein